MHSVGRNINKTVLPQSPYSLMIDKVDVVPTLSGALQTYSTQHPIIELIHQSQYRLPSVSIHEIEISGCEKAIKEDLRDVKRLKYARN